VTGLPCRDVVQRHGVVRILGHFLVHVEHDQRHEHVLQVDLVHGLEAGMKVRGRIHVRAPLPDMAILVDPESVLLHGVQRLHALVGGPFQWGIPGANACVRSTKRWT